MAFSHHSNESGDNIRRLFASSSDAEKMFREQQRGVNKRSYPEGRLGANDEGALAFKVYGDKEKQLVGMDFGKQVREIAMSPQQAIELAQSLIKMARATSTDSLTIVLH